MSDRFTKRYYELERITEILLGCNCSTTIGIYPDSVACRLVYAELSNPSISTYRSINSQAYEEVIKKLNSITNGEMSKAEAELSLEELTHENYQTVKAVKKKGDAKSSPL